MVSRSVTSALALLNAAVIIILAYQLSFFVARVDIVSSHQVVHVNLLVPL